MRCRLATLYCVSDNESDDNPSKYLTDRDNNISQMRSANHAALEDRLINALLHGPFHSGHVHLLDTINKPEYAKRSVRTRSIQSWTNRGRKFACIQRISARLSARRDRSRCVRFLRPIQQITHGNPAKTRQQPECLLSVERAFLWDDKIREPAVRRFAITVKGAQSENL